MVGGVGEEGSFAIVATILYVIIFVILVFVTHGPSVVGGRGDDGTSFRVSSSFVHFVSIKRNSDTLVCDGKCSTLVSLNVSMGSSSVVSALGTYSVRTVSVIVVSRCRDSRVNTFRSITRDFRVGGVVNPGMISGGVGTTDRTGSTILSSNNGFCRTICKLGFRLNRFGVAILNCCGSDSRGGHSICIVTRVSNIGFLFANSNRLGTRDGLLREDGSVSYSILGITRRNDGANANCRFLGTAAPRCTMVSINGNGDCGRPRVRAIATLRGRGDRICHASVGNSVDFCIRGNRVRIGARG